MTKKYSNIHYVKNLYKSPSQNSEIVTQMIYGDSYSILKKDKKWALIKIKEDNYKGFIKDKDHEEFFKPTHKVHRISAYVYKFPNKKNEISRLTFGSKIKVIKKQSNFLKFNKGWIRQNDVKPISFREKSLFKKIKIFQNKKYKWGGKSFKGIDCSALIQVCLNFNNKYCPRDTGDQFKFFKKNIKLANIKKDDIIYWKGHVAVALSKKKLIHAYGPMKKTVVMDIDKTIKRIKETANLKVVGIKRI